MPSKYIQKKKEYRPKEDRYVKKGWADVAYEGARHLLPLAAAGGAALLAGFNTEKKCFDLQATPTFTAINTATAAQFGATILTNIQQGDGGDQCNGNSVRVSDFMLRLEILWPLSTFQESRFLLFIDRENTGVTPTIAEILEDTQTINLMTSPLNRSNFGRFDILKDIHFNPQIDTNCAKTEYIDMTFGEEKLAHRGEHHLTWDDTNNHSTIASTRNGHIWMIWLNLSKGMTNGLNPSITYNAVTSPSIYYWARTRYVDN